MKLDKRPLKSALALAALSFLTLLTPAGAQLVGQFGILDLEANGAINPNTGVAWKVGDQYRLAFHTAGSTGAFNGTSNDPNVYNGYVTAEAQANPALAGSTWFALVTVNLDAMTTQDLSPKSDPRVVSGTADQTGGFAQGGAGVPVYAMDGKTCIARNNADIWNTWSNPFEDSPGVVNATGNGNNTIRWASGTGPAPASQNVFYSPFLNQFGVQTVTPDTVHGKDIATGTNTNGTHVNALGNTTDNTTFSRGNTNANNTARIWNRFTDATTTNTAFYALSELLTVSTGGPTVPFAITAFEFTLSADPLVPSMVSLTWTSKPGARYAVRYTTDLTGWPGDFDDSATGAADSGTTTRSYPFDAAVAAPDGKFFVRVEDTP